MFYPFFGFRAENCCPHCGSVLVWHREAGKEKENTPQKACSAACLVCGSRQSKS